jgi:adenine phosphoribosyltransferase
MPRGPGLLAGHCSRYFPGNGPPEPSPARMHPLTKLVRSVPDFPSPGIVFRDITPLLSDAEAFGVAVEEMSKCFRGMNVDRIAAIESRGFILGAAMAYTLGSGLVPIRKPGKLPRATVTRSYDLEYGSNRLEVHADAIAAAERVVLVDDVLATGGTAAAAVELIRELGGEVVEAVFLIELEQLRGRSRLPGVPVRSVLTY